MTVNTLLRNTSLFQMCKNDGFPLVLQALLDQIPILLVGGADEICQEISTTLLSIVSDFRHAEVYLSSFASVQALSENNTKFGLASSTPLILAPIETTESAITEIDNFRGWLIHTLPEQVGPLRSKIAKFHPVLAVVYLDEYSNILSSAYLGSGAQEKVDLSFEQGILNRTLRKVEEPIVKIKRIMEGSWQKERLKHGEGLFFESAAFLEYESERNLLLLELLKMALGSFFLLCQSTSRFTSNPNNFDISNINIKLDSSLLFTGIGNKKMKLSRIQSFIEGNAVNYEKKFNGNR